jgi:hypothetical protein
MLVHLVADITKANDGGTIVSEADGSKNGKAR